MIGAHRIGNACLSLQFDHNLTKFDQTFVVCPLGGDRMKKVFEKYKINTQGFVYVSDSDLFEKFPSVANWYMTGETRGSWLTQQAMKFCMLDTVDADVICIQDADIFFIKPYNCVVDNKLNVFYVAGRYAKHPQQYYQAFENITGLPRQTEYSFVTDIMPVFKQDWHQLKSSIAQRFDQHWLDVLIDQTPWDYIENLKWFSEYEILGNWMVSQHTQFQLIEQGRFEYKRLEQLTHEDFPSGIDCQIERNPSGRILPFDYGTDTVLNLDAVLDRFVRAGLLN